MSSGRAWADARVEALTHLPGVGPDGKVIAGGARDRSVRFWRLPRGGASQMRGFPFKPKHMAWDSESRLLATSGDAAATL